MRASRVPRTALLALLPALLPLLAAFHGAAGPRAAELNFGPGDGPYLQGFASTWEIGEDGAALHWSRRAASVTLPLEATGPLDVVYRFSPPPGGGGVLVSVAGQVDRFEAIEGRWGERRLSVSAAPATPLDWALRWKETIPAILASAWTTSASSSDPPVGSGFVARRASGPR